MLVYGVWCVYVRVCMRVYAIILSSNGVEPTEKQ